MKKIIYIKYSNERAEKYAVRTEILQDEKMRRYVYKTACFPAGEAHIQNIIKNYYRLDEQFRQTPISLNPCRVFEKGVELEYIQGLTMEEQLDAFLYAKEYDKAETLLTAYLTEIYSVCSQNVFKMTDSFRAVFGEAVLPEGLVCGTVTNIDMVFSNVILTGSWELIDYEWTFDFPIPVHYVIYRTLHYYLDVSEIRRRMKGRRLYQKFGIDSDQIAAYEKMERHFQRHIEEGHVPIRDMYPDIAPQKFVIGELVSNEIIRQKRDRLQVFFAGDENFSEAQSKSYQLVSGSADVTVIIPPGTKKMRLDPGEDPGLVNIEALSYDSKSGVHCRYITNGSQFCEGQILYEKPDPQIILTEIPVAAGSLRIKLHIDTITANVAAVMKHLQCQSAMQTQKVTELSKQLDEREKLIGEMESTKVWRIYQKMKNPDGKGKINE